jgi:hypothetical protein
MKMWLALDLPITASPAFLNPAKIERACDESQHGRESEVNNAVCHDKQSLCYLQRGPVLPQSPS